jgi:hypothetical protein
MEFFSKWFKKPKQEEVPLQTTPVLPVEVPNPIVVPVVSEDPFRVEAARISKEVLVELEKKEGKRCFVLIIDDTKRKTDDLIRDLNEHMAKAGVYYAIRNAITGITIDEEFAKLASSEKVVIFMDGFLDTQGRDTGPKVTAELKKLVTEKGFSAPLVVAESSDAPMNNSICSAYPEAYIGPFITNEDRVNTLAALDSRL